VAGSADKDVGLNRNSLRKKRVFIATTVSTWTSPGSNLGLSGVPLAILSVERDRKMKRQT
jgi:hypothetical protein